MPHSCRIAATRSALTELASQPIRIFAGTGKGSTTLTKRDQEICARLGPELKRRGLIFAGIDVIGDYLTEINVTSPTGIRQVAAFGGPDIAAMIWDVVEGKLKAQRAKRRA